MIGQVHRVWTRDDSQGFGEMVAVREIQIKHISDLWVLWTNKMYYFMF